MSENGSRASTPGFLPAGPARRVGLHWGRPRSGWPVSLIMACADRRICPAGATIRLIQLPNMIAVTRDRERQG